MVSTIPAMPGPDAVDQVLDLLADGAVLEGGLVQKLFCQEILFRMMTEVRVIQKVFHHALDDIVVRRLAFPESRDLLFENIEQPRHVRVIAAQRV